MHALVNKIVIGGNYYVLSVKGESIHKLSNAPNNLDFSD